jgi:CRP/FNR family transcriptional regulator, cyclic AMP receptor protein
MHVGDLEFVSHLTPELRTFVLGKVRQIRAKRGQAILGRGGATADVYFILEGVLSAVMYSTNGREVIMRSLPVGAVFGELAAVDGLPRSASVVAETDARVVALRREDFMACLETCPAAALWLARLLAGKVRDMTERIFELSALNVQARLHCELLRMAKAVDERALMRIDPAPTHAELANRIGTHREAVTREMRVLVERKIIKASRRSLEFVDLPRLEHFVGQAVGELIERQPVT